MKHIFIAFLSIYGLFYAIRLTILMNCELLNYDTSPLFQTLYLITF